MGHGMCTCQNRFLTTSQLWTESLFKERGVTAILGAHVQRVESGKVFYETVQGEEGVVDSTSRCCSHRFGAKT
jgi:sulfide:quinone oxidoreductase